MQKTFHVKNKKYTFDLDSATITVQNGEKEWTQDQSFDGAIIVPNGEKNATLFFSKAKEISKEIYEDGIADLNLTARL